MTEREALLRAVCEFPDDDTPRLVFADWLQEHGEEESAEFIRLQIEYAKRFEAGATLEDDPDAIRAELLEATSGSQWWGGPPPPRQGVKFQMWRGFPFWIVAPNIAALKKAEHSEPGLLAVEYLTIGHLTRDAAKYLSKRWYTPHIRLLKVTRLGIWGGLFSEFFSAADWSGLRYLSLRGCDLGYAGVNAIAEHAGLSSLRVLDLRETGLANGGVASLCRSTHFSNLVCLRLEGNMFLKFVHCDLQQRFGDRARF